MKQDPRIRRTRKRLHETLLRLSIERGYDAVSVQDILDSSETARSTFYAHFRDKDDLLLSGFQEVDNALFSNGAFADAENPTLKEFSFSLFQHVDQNKQLAKAFIGSTASSMVFGHLRNLIVVEIRKWLSRQNRIKNNEIPIELTVQYVAGAIYSLLTWWMDHDFSFSVRQMSETSDTLISLGLSHYG